MEKQSLIKYYCALFLVLVVLAGSNSVAMGEPSQKPSISPSAETATPSPVRTHSANQDTNSDNSMLFPLLLSILALAVSGGAIALTIFNSKKFINRIQSDDRKHTNEINSIKEDYRKLSTSQISLPSNQSLETSIRNSTASNNNAYLESDIQRLSVRITEIEDKLKASQNNQQSIHYSNPTYLSTQSHNLEADIDPFNQTINLSKFDITQPPDNLAYIELVNTYNTNSKLLEHKAIKVSEPTDSINRRHADSSQKIVLEKANNSNYWVIHDNAGRDCWLLPKSKLRIDQFRYETTKALFECHGYQTEYSTFKLVKPAKVTSLSTDDQTWQLEEPGILEFSVEA